MWSSTPGWPRPAAATPTVPADAMARWLLPAVLVLLSQAAPAAEEVEQLDADFLEYLANLEGDDDDWTLMAAAEEARAAAGKGDDPPRKAAKEADPPAADER
jgi:hypothetical protein